MFERFLSFKICGIVKFTTDATVLSSSIVINGDALDEEILKEANLDGSETVLALTNDDENNMRACVLAEITGLKKRTIAIVKKANYNLLQVM